MDKSLEAALAAHRAGRIDEAAAHYQTILAQKPNHADALHLLGLVHQQRGDLKEAERLIRRALQGGDNAVMLGNLGIVLRRTQQLGEAEVIYRRALRLQPDHAETWNNLGNLLRDRLQPAEAEAAYGKALALKPDYAEACINLGHVLRQRGAWEPAAAAYRQALQLRPTDLPLWLTLADLLFEAQALAEAEALYRQVIDLRPGDAGPIKTLAGRLVLAGRAREAEELYRRALAVQPSDADACNSLANLLSDLGQVAEAEILLRRTLALQPGHAGALVNLGNLLTDALRFAEAEPLYREALDRDPDFPEALNGFGWLLQNSGRMDAAEAAFRRAISLRPEAVSARMNLGFLLLNLGRYGEAWPHLEARHGLSDPRRQAALPRLPYPQWQGQPLEGRSLVLWPEQGFGDAIQFARYAKSLKQRGLSRLTLACAPALQPLLTTLADVDCVTSDLAGLAPHDYWAMPLSLPLRCGTEVASIPADLPYLKPLPQRLMLWAERLDRMGLGAQAIKIGLVWKGSSTHANDAHRSLPSLDVLAPLWSVPGLSFVSLQKGQGEDEAALWARAGRLIHVGHDIADFGDTAALVEQMDLIITVDTAIAHVAGALGKSCWVLLPAYRLDWRWLFDSSASPWYPGVMRLFRQSRLGDWRDPVDAMAAALARSMPKSRP